MTTSLNGWPYPAVALRRILVPGTTRYLTVEVSCAPLLAAVAADYHRLISPIDTGAFDDAGYCDRNARLASARKSNHSNGTAIDLNWSKEGAQGSAFGREFFARPLVALRILRMKRRYGSCIQWGGDWNARDYMHWEVKPGATKADVAALIKKLGIDADGNRPVKKVSK